ncbi:MAG: hypothetical protein RQ752_09785, partial [Thermohalobaculum sp.]|nr:hypothetical protein [Thermohalobaculum sp.]
VGSETTCIHLGPDAWELGKHQPADAAVLGDPGEVMGALADRIEVDQRTRDTRLERVRETKAGLADTLDSIGRGSDDEDPRASKAEVARRLAERVAARLAGEGVA